MRFLSHRKSKLVRPSIMVSVFLCGVTTPAICSGQLDITVDYFDGFDGSLGSKRRETFEHAVSIWESSLVGTIPIKVYARFSNLGSGTSNAANGGPTATFFTANGIEGTRYPAALASQIDQFDVSPTLGQFAGYHLQVTFNVNTPFYYGADGAGTLAQADFLHVALHELGHGFGFNTQINKQTGVFGIENPAAPSIYDRRLAIDLFGLGDYISFTSDLLNPTTRITVMQNGNIFFDGPATTPIARIHGGPGMAETDFGEFPRVHDDPELGAVVVHWHALHSPGLLMQTGLPIFANFHDLDLSIPVMRDIGWQVVSPRATFALVFPKTNPGSSSAQKAALFTNLRSPSLTISSVGLSGPHANQFTIVSGGASGSLSGFSSRNIQVRFDPTSVGLKKRT